MFCHNLHFSLCTPFERMGRCIGTVIEKSFVRKDKVCDYLRNPNIDKFMGPNGTQSPQLNG